MQDKEFYDLLLCYLATDSYDPEALKDLLTGDPKLSAAFRANLKGLSSDENWSVAAASKDLNYGFRNSTDLGKWLLRLDSFLFGDGPVTLHLESTLEPDATVRGQPGLRGGVGSCGLSCHGNANALPIAGSKDPLSFGRLP